MFANHFLRCSAVVPGYRLKATWPKQPKLPSRSDPAVLSAGWEPLSSSRDPGEDINCQSLFCEEIFFKHIFGWVDPNHVPTNNISCRVSSGCSCFVVFDCLDQRASCLNAAIPLLDSNDSYFSRMRSRWGQCPKATMAFIFFLTSKRQIYIFFFSVYLSYWQMFLAMLESWLYPSQASALDEKILSNSC